MAFTVTIKAILMDYPTITSTLDVKIELVHTCEGPYTSNIPSPGLSNPGYSPIVPMVSFIGAAAVTQDLTQVTSDITVTLQNGLKCVGFTKSLAPATSFLSLSPDQSTLSL